MQENNDNHPYPSDSIADEASQLDSICKKKKSIMKPLHYSAHPKKSRHAEIGGISEESLNSIRQNSSRRNLKERLQGIHLNEEHGYAAPAEYLMTNCWDSNRSEAAKKLVELFKESSGKEEDLDIPIKKIRLEEGLEDKKSPPYTREYHMLTEVQKSRILTAVEDTIKKLAENDCYTGLVKEDHIISPAPNDQVNTERVICKKFLLPWVLMKVSEMVVCHIIQLTFLSDPLYFEKKNDFVPIVVTYYLTLFVIVLSLLIHISCFSYTNVQNPCYFMGVISSSLLTLTLTIGMLIMLSTMNYYRTYRQTLVLLFISLLAFLLFVELYLFYVEVKNIWSRTEQIDQNYIT